MNENERKKLLELHTPFIEAFKYNLKEHYNYKDPYILICVGTIAKNGIKTWWDLVSLSTIDIWNMPIVNKNVKNELVRMKDKETWNANCYATFAAFNDMHMSRYHTLLRKHLFNERMFTWIRLLEISNGEILNTKYLGPKTVINIGKLKNNKVFDERYKENLDFHYQIMRELGI